MHCRLRQGGPVPTEGHNDGFSSAVSDMKSLIAHARQGSSTDRGRDPSRIHPGTGKSGANVMGLDEITSHYRCERGRIMR
jgi:hypothetical protein